MYVREHVSVQVCEHRVGWEQGEDKDQEKGFCVRRQLCSEPFTKVMCCAPHSCYLAQLHHFYPCLTCWGTPQLSPETCSQLCTGVNIQCSLPVPNTLLCLLVFLTLMFIFKIEIKFKVILKYYSDVQSPAFLSGS